MATVETDEREALLAKVRAAVGEFGFARYGYGQATTENLRRTVAGFEEQLARYRRLGFVEKAT